MNANTKIIIGATAAMAISFFLPWINFFVGGIAPSTILEMGSEAMSFGTVVFLGSFLLAAATAVLHATGKGDPKMAIATGALPFLMLAWLIIKSNSAMDNNFGASIPWGDMGQLLQIIAIGLPVYAIGALTTLIVGYREMKGQQPVGFISPGSASADDAS